jgi:hypothetical protein
MNSPSPSLDSLLSILSEKSPLVLIEAEAAALTSIVGSIYQSICQRKKLESDLLGILEYRELYLGSKILNIHPYENRSELEHLGRLEEDRIQVERQRIQTQETTAKDIISLQNLALHYWFSLQRKAFLIRFLK